MTCGPIGNRRRWEKFILKEIEKAIEEKRLSEEAFEWAKDDPDAIDAVISRMEAAMENYNYLLKQAKKMGISLNKQTLLEKILKDAKS